MNSGILRPGPNGVPALLVAVASAVAGRFFGLDVALVAAALIACLTGMSAVWLAVPRTEIVAHRAMGYEALHAGESATVSISVAASRTTAGAEITEPVSGHGSARALCERLRPEPITLNYRIGELRRGAIELGPLVVEVGDPFGLVTCRYSPIGISHLLVRPRLVQVTAPSTGDDDSRSGSGRFVGDHASSVDTDGLRDWQPGDDVRHVHWGATARGGTPVVRTFAAPATETVRVALDRTGAPGAEFELAVVAAASLVRHFTSENRAVELWLLGPHGPEVIVGLGDDDLALDALATVEPLEGEASTAEATRCDVIVSIDPDAAPGRAMLRSGAAHGLNAAPQSTLWDGRGPLTRPNRGPLSAPSPTHLLITGAAPAAGAAQ